MKQSRRLAILALACGLLSLPSRGRAIDLALTGSWSLSIDASDLISGAGSDLRPSYESSPDQVAITVSNTTGNWDWWRVDVRLIPIHGHPDLTLGVRRTGSGVGGGGVYGGGSYLQVTTADQTFFFGRGDRADIPLQLEISGVSVAILPDTYSATVVYTVVDL